MNNFHQLKQSNIPQFEEKDSEELTELLRLMAQASIYGSEEHRRLELRTNELIDKFGGADNILDQLDKQRKFAK
jgi:hypothetical protein